MSDASTHRAKAPGHRPGASARTKTLLLTIALVAAGAAVLAVRPPHGSLTGSTHLAWWIIAVSAAAAQLLIFHIEMRREVYTFTLSEVPLVLGLFLASPTALIAGRLAGELAVLTLKDRQPVRKLAFNLATFFAECTVLVTVGHALDRHWTVSQPLSWVVALVAVLLADFVGFLAVAKAVSWHGSPFAIRSILLTGAMTAVINTSLALVVANLVVAAPWATLLLGTVAGFLVLGYRGYSSLAQRYSSLQLLYDFTRLVSGSKRPEVVLEAILTQARELLRAENAVIWLSPDEQGDPVVLRVTEGQPVATATTLPDDFLTQLRGWFENGGAVVVPAQRRDDLAVEVLERLGGEDLVAAPISDGSKVIGVIAVTDRMGGYSTFDGQDGKMFETLANHASVALENGRLIDRLQDEAQRREYEALHDALTGLPNRVLFTTRLTELVAAGADAPAAVYLMDLDGFKEVNDTLGHHCGDLVLAEVSRRLLRHVDGSVTVARLGGDEFALLCPQVADAASATELGLAARAEIAQPMTIEGLTLAVGASVGIALFPDHGTDVATLLQRADVAMYSAKGGNGAGVELYSADRDVNTPRRLALTNELRRAVEDGQVMVHYQPKARFSDGTIVGAEALVRWRHPEFGYVYPDEFIPLAERTGVIQELSDFVLETAVEQISSWAADGWGLSVAVNLSMRNLMDTALPTRLARLIDHHRIDPAKLTLEITETNVMSDPTRVVHVLHELSDIGARIAIDDFGTGYSSLSYLQRMPVDEVKIDKSFVLPMVSDPGAAAIVRSIIDLARNLDLDVVAEGVEDRRTWDQLTLLRCTIAQGYYLSRPISAADLEQWLAGRQVLERRSA